MSVIISVFFDRISKRGLRHNTRSIGLSTVAAVHAVSYRRRSTSWRIMPSSHAVTGAFQGLLVCWFVVDSRNFSTDLGAKACWLRLHV